MIAPLQASTESRSCTPNLPNTRTKVHEMHWQFARNFTQHPVAPAPHRMVVWQPVAGVSVLPVWGGSTTADALHGLRVGMPHGGNALPPRQTDAASVPRDGR